MRLGIYPHSDTYRRRKKESREVTDILDVHSHILPKLDDGASTGKMSVEMLRSAAAQGVRRVIATPHYSPFFPNTDPERIRGLCRGLNRKAAKVGIECRVRPGQEIMYSEGVLELLDKGKLLTMAGSRYILIEFDPSAPYSLIYKAVKESVSEGYSPILAHVERYQSVREKGKADELVGQGAYLQMNYRSIGGNWRSSTTRWCRDMLREEKIHFLGTDMHNMTTRRPEIMPAYEWLKKHLETDYIRRITRDNAKMILSDKKIH